MTKRPKSPKPTSDRGASDLEASAFVPPSIILPGPQDGSETAPPHPSPHAAAPKKAWSEEDRKLLIQKANVLPWKEIGICLGRSWVSCQQRYFRLLKTRGDYWSKKEEVLLLRQVLKYRPTSPEQWKKISNTFERHSWESCKLYYEKAIRSNKEECTPLVEGGG